MWDDAYSIADPARDGHGAHTEVEPDVAVAAPVATATEQPRRAAPKRSARAAFNREVAASDTPQGKAFAEVQELFPGRVVEVVPILPASDQGGPQGGSEGTEEEFAAGYDDPTSEDAAGNDA